MDKNIQAQGLRIRVKHAITFSQVTANFQLSLKLCA